jgi:hypothetical protein
MLRSELVAAVARALYEVTRDPDKVNPTDMAEAAIAKAEPFIRADERKKVNASWQVDYDAEMEILRAAVEALRFKAVEFEPRAEAIDDVLDLIDGSSNSFYTDQKAGAAAVRHTTGMRREDDP